MQDTAYVERKILKEDIEKLCINILRDIQDPNLTCMDLIKVDNLLNQAVDIMIPFIN